jgi:hypothetical protein
MIKETIGNSRNIIQVCDRCGKENKVVIPPQHTLKFLEEINQFENYKLPTCACGTVEILNMNLEEDEYAISEYMDDREWNSRNNIKAIRKVLKGDQSNFAEFKVLARKKPLRKPT